MTAIYYDCLPLNESRWVLRCACNGRESFRSNPGEGEREFVNRCMAYVKEKDTPERRAILRVYTEEW